MPTPKKPETCKHSFWKDRNPNTCLSCGKTEQELLTERNKPTAPSEPEDWDEFVSENCRCHVAQPYGFVPEAGCPEHDTYRFTDFLAWVRSHAIATAVQSERNSPMGVSQWREHGKKFDYWQYFEKQAVSEERARLLAALPKIHCGKCDGAKLLEHHLACKALSEVRDLLTK